MFFTKGIEKHKDYLNSFEAVLKSVGIGIYCQVMISSIFSKNCKRISREEELIEIKYDQTTFAVMLRNSTKKPNHLILASIETAINVYKSNYRYLSEYLSFGFKEKIAGY